MHLPRTGMYLTLGGAQAGWRRLSSLTWPPVGVGLVLCSSPKVGALPFHFTPPPPLPPSLRKGLIPLLKPF